MVLSRQTRARIAWVRSYFKRTWEFEDYPVDYIDQGISSIFAAPRFQYRRWRADLLGSHICGLGDDQSQALADARKNFEQYRLTGGELPRPGSRMKIVFPENQTIDQYPNLQKHFINTVLNLPWAWVTDSSSLGDFHTEHDDAYLRERIWHTYGVDVSNVEDGNLSRILTGIMDEIHDFPEDEITRSIRMGRDSRDRRVAMLPVPKWIQNEDDEEDRLNGII